MKTRIELPELWLIGYKAVVLLFVISQSMLSEGSLSPWFMLFLLLYLCVNLLLIIVKNAILRPIIAVFAIGVILVPALQDNMQLILLLPLNLYDLSSVFAGRQGKAAILLMLLPLFVIPQELIEHYLLIAAVSLLYFSMMNKLVSKMDRQLSELEGMRGDLEKLQTRLWENTEFMRQTEYTLKLEERNRLSQDIHDHIGHAMTGALIQMEAAKRIIRTDPEKSGMLLGNAIQISKEGIESIRSELKRMKPTTEQLGINRMKLFIDEFSAKHPIQTRLTHDGNIDLITPIQWKIIMENTKEALTNVMKYSGATTVSVRIQVLNTLIRVEILDNGKGVQKLIKGLGITGMEERAASLNGTVIVDGSRGFSVTTLLPFAIQE